MLKKSYQKIACTAILLVLVVSMLASMLGATSADIYTVTVNIPNPDALDSVVLEVDGVAQPIDEEKSDRYKYVYEFNSNIATLSLKIKTKSNGYTIKDLLNEEDKPLGAANAGKTQYNLPLANGSYTLQTEEKVFTFVVTTGDYPAYGGISPKDDPNGKSYRFNSGDLALPIPTLAGYTFQGWKWSDAEGNGHVLLPEGPEDAQTVPFPTTICPASGNVVYLQPVWSAAGQPVIRYDYEYDPTGNSFTPVYGYASDLMALYSTSWQAPTGTRINGKDGGNDIDLQHDELLDEGGYKIYPGYVPFVEYADEVDGKGNPIYYTIWKSVQASTNNADINKVYRYYKAIEYTLAYTGFENCEDAWLAYQSVDGYKTTHIFNQSTEIPQPERVGYNFAGWKVYVNGKDVTASINSEVSAIRNLTLNARNIAFAEGNTENIITLEATWIPKTFSVSYNWGDVARDDITFDESAYALYTYDSLLEIPAPVRKGYIFLGWTLTCENATDEAIDALDGKTVLGGKYLGDITLTARWQAKTYTVVLNGNGTEYTADELQAVYDAIFNPAAVAIPLREGHTFRGFWSKNADGELDICWIGEDGKPIADQIWQIDSDDKITLWAKWEVNQYDVTVDVGELLQNGVVEVYFGDVRFDGTAQKFDYGTALKIRIVVTDQGYKLTKWCGVALDEHVRDMTFDYVVGISNELGATVLQVIDTSEISVNFANETLFLPNGTYVITCDGQKFDVLVLNGIYTVNNTPATSFVIDDAFFGKTMHLIVRGVDGVSADNECSIALPARPDAPAFSNQWISNINPSHNSIEITMNKSVLDTLYPNYTFEYACVLADATDAKLEWVTMVMDENGLVKIPNLSYGTKYMLYIRVKATENEPCGKSFETSIKTEHENYIKETIKTLENQLTGGEMADAIEKIEEIREKGDSITAIQAAVEAVLREVPDRLELAKAQDTRIAELTAKYNALLATKELDAAGEATLKTLFETAVDAIQHVLENTELETLTERLDEVNRICTETLKKMSAIEITYLYQGDAHRLTIMEGLPQGSKWSVSYVTDYNSLLNAIETAIRTGNVSMDGAGIELDELATLVLKAYYRMKLELPDNAMPEDSVYEIRLLLPESLRRSNLGMQVAYYKESGELIVLDTERDGDYLVFKSNTSGVCDFVILCDDEVNLRGLIWALSLTVLAQLVAIVFLLIRRSKSGKQVKMSSFAIPAVLAVHFLPNNALTIVLCLGALAVILQIVLMILLLTSDIIFRRKKTAPTELDPDPMPVDEPIAPYADLTTVKAVEDAPAPDAEETALTEDAEETWTDDDESVAFVYSEEAVEAAESVSAQESEEVFAVFDGDTDETPSAEADEGEELFVAENGEVYDDYDFIEPAADPRYSLPDEDEGVFATEEVYAPAGEEAYAEETYAEETYAEETYAEEPYAEAEGADEDVPFLFELDEDTAEESEEGYADETPAEEWQEGTVWESDEIAPAPEEEILYEDYVTGDPSDPMMDTDDIVGDPNPYEVIEDDESERTED